MSAITNLTPLNTVTGGMLLPIVDTSVSPYTTKQVNVDKLGHYVNNALLSTIIPPATTSTLGGVIVGSGLSVTTSGYITTVPTIATTSTLGSVIVGQGLTVTTSGVLVAVSQIVLD